MLGEGILKGLGETARNFAGSFVSAERLTTVQYPEERIAPIEDTRDFPFLVYDGTDWEAGLRCVACQICEKECPPKCIYIVKSTDKKPDALGKPQIYPARFDIDISVCMSCQICVEVCPFEAIKMDTEFELSTRTVSGGCCTTRRNWPNRTSTTTRFILRKRRRLMRGWRKRKPRQRPKLKLQRRLLRPRLRRGLSRRQSRLRRPRLLRVRLRRYQLLR